MRAVCMVGIAGGTASGKTTLARRLFDQFGADTACVLELDSYYHSREHLSFQEREKTNYDHPDAFDFDLLVEHVNLLVAGSSVEVPVYDFSQHTRDPGRVRRVEPRRVILVEGILSLAHPPLCDLFHLKVFVDAPTQLRLERRIERDVRERGRTRESVLAQWNETVHPMHEAFCEPTRAVADRVFDGVAFCERQMAELSSLISAEGGASPAKLLRDKVT